MAIAHIGLDAHTRHDIIVAADSAGGIYVFDGILLELI